MRKREAREKARTREEEEERESDGRKGWRSTYPLYLSNVIGLIILATIEHWSLHRVTLGRKTSTVAP